MKPNLYDSGHQSKDAVKSYLKLKNNLSYYLAWRDIPELLAHFCEGRIALDYGCGTGFSTVFLKEQNYEVVGVDVNSNMLEKANEQFPNLIFYPVEQNKLPFHDNFFDLLFSSGVLYEIPSKEILQSYFNEAYRVAKQGAIFLIVTGSDHYYTGDWLLIKNQYPENRSLNSGSKAKILYGDANIEFMNYIWTESDCIQCIEKSGFELLEIHSPYGLQDEGYNWKDEKYISPYSLFIARKPI